MKKLLFALFCISVSLCYAEEPVNVKIRKSDANIVGDVKDKSTQEHIPYATVSIQGTTIGTVTDNTGHYFLKNLPVGEFKITVNCLGYKPITKKSDYSKRKNIDYQF
jgi:outer membrane receptor for ferrienterochelin and colicins